ncbi:MAG: hypothetical protein ABW133_07765, partial [Polyangiaceae bacterium]
MNDDARPGVVFGGDCAVPALGEKRFRPKEESFSVDPREVNPPLGQLPSKVSVAQRGNQSV